MGLWFRDIAVSKALLVYLQTLSSVILSLLMSITFSLVLVPRRPSSLKARLPHSRSWPSIISTFAPGLLRVIWTKRILMWEMIIMDNCWKIKSSFFVSEYISSLSNLFWSVCFLRKHGMQLGSRGIPRDSLGENCINNQYCLCNRPSSLTCSISPIFEA